MNVKKMEGRDDWSGDLWLYALLFGVPWMMLVGGKFLLAFCKACRRGGQKTALIGLGGEEAKDTKQMEKKLEELVGKASVADKLKLMEVMKEDLDNVDSKIKLMSVDVWGRKDEFDTYISEDMVRGYALNKRWSGDIVHEIAREMVFVVKSKKLCQDEKDSEQFVRAFIECMMEHYMTEEYMAENDWEYPAKCDLDAILIATFVENVNLWCRGLTQAEVDRVNNTVLHEFNVRSDQHNAGVRLLLERAPLM